MARLIEFKSSESELFEVLSVIFFTADQPSPAENKASIKAEDAFDKYGVPTKESKFKTIDCTFCKQRIMISPRIYTLPAGTGADLILDDKVFDYIHTRFDKWQVILDSKLKRPFEELKDRFDETKRSKLDDFDKIRKYLEDRDAKLEYAAGSSL